MAHTYLDMLFSGIRIKYSHTYIRPVYTVRHLHRTVIGEIVNTQQLLSQSSCALDFRGGLSAAHNM